MRKLPSLIPVLGLSLLTQAAFAAPVAYKLDFVNGAKYSLLQHGGSSLLLDDSAGAPQIDLDATFATPGSLTAGDVLTQNGTAILNFGSGAEALSVEISNLSVAVGDQHVVFASLGVNNVHNVESYAFDYRVTGPGVVDPIVGSYTGTSGSMTKFNVLRLYDDGTIGVRLDGDLGNDLAFSVLARGEEVVGAPVPEPATLLLGLLGAGAVGLRRRARRAC
jgi:hypothetical protein